MSPAVEALALIVGVNLVSLAVGWIVGRFGERDAVVRRLGRYGVGPAIISAIARGEHRR